MIEQSLGDPPKDIPRDCLPMLVTFDDITKPCPVRTVDPKELAAVFGGGVGLTAVTLEITRETVTEAGQALLPWLWPCPKPGLCPATCGPLGDAPFCRLVKMSDIIRRP
jgi:hypothetical protein